MIRSGMGDKIGQYYMGLFQMLTGFVLAFFFGPQLAGWLLLFMPAIIICFICFLAGITGGIRELAVSYAQCAGYAEQALNGIKVVQTYGQEKLEGINYARYLEGPKKAQHTLVRNLSLGLAAIFAVIFFYYGYALTMGGKLRVDEVEISEGVKYDGGTIILVTFSVVTASFALAGVGQNIKIISEAQIAGNMAYSVIDHVPDVNPNATTYKIGDKELPIEPVNKDNL